ncbi:MAG: GH3 auxin-responsive promoter family protein, partial [Chloroflexia bacterium]|nr:GH3 auxin-responsive promoter family protein [Chloroflexia bacterium]
KFTSKNPFRIKITGRTKHFINAFGEELIVDNAEAALKKACERTGAEIREYTASPIYMTDERNGGHQWLIEFTKMPDNLEHFMEILDTTLKSVNSDYEAKRYKNISLAFPIVEIARENLFYDWLKERGRLGGQNKVPRLANNREFMDRLLELNKR